MFIMPSLGYKPGLGWWQLEAFSLLYQVTREEKAMQRTINTNTQLFPIHSPKIRAVIYE